MLNRSGARTGSKSAKQSRRSIVFRFLAGCKPEELLYYLKMAFRLFTTKVQGAIDLYIQLVITRSPYQVFWTYTHCAEFE